jgi:thiamine kinase-like enzyme
LPELLHFDQENSIIILNYLTEYTDLSDFYIESSAYPSELAASVGYILGSLHKATFNRDDYRRFWLTEEQEFAAQQSVMLAKGLERIGPEIFGEFPAEALKFFSLYQRYESLSQAISELSQSVKLSCLIHNDLKFNNVLLHRNWEDLAVEISQPSPLRLIDWERCTWGDPALDLGTLVASYLQIWLNSMVVSSSLDIQESLRLATIPLEKLQSSTFALVEAYLNQFPEILDDRPDFVKRVVQYAGLMIIRQINAMIQYQKTFSNTGICMLQVAKSLLCRPETSVQSIFGVSEVGPMQVKS